MEQTPRICKECAFYNRRLMFCQYHQEEFKPNDIACVGFVMPKPLVDDDVDQIDTQDEDKANPLNEQIGGNHYSKMAIQPVEFIEANHLPFIEGNIVKYACRHESKNGAEDIRKVIHYAKLLLKLRYGISE